MSYFRSIKHETNECPVLLMPRTYLPVEGLGISVDLLDVAGRIPVNGIHRTSALQ